MHPDASVLEDLQNFNLQVLRIEILNQLTSAHFPCAAQAWKVSCFMPCWGSDRTPGNLQNRSEASNCIELCLRCGSNSEMRNRSKPCLIAANVAQ